jgi:RHH-type rel operon transcriptional repressor/antitoxin RelB
MKSRFAPGYFHFPFCRVGASSYGRQRPGIMGICNYFAGACGLTQGGAMITIRLSEELETRLASLADATGRSKGFFVREALERSLDEIEDEYLAEASYERFASDDENAVLLARIVKTCELED